MKTTQLSYMAPGLWTVEEMTVKYLSESPYVNFVNIDEHLTMRATHKIIT